MKATIKQTLAMIRENRLFTGIYILGTAVAIASTMVIAIILYVKIANVYPEVNRNNTYYLQRASFVTKNNGGTNTWSFSDEAMREWWYGVKNAKTVSGNKKATVLLSSQLKSKSAKFAAKYTDPNFFKIFEYEFIEGRPFTQEEFESMQKVVVISDNAARELFHTDTDVTGKNIYMNQDTLQVVGVVKSASPLTPYAYADMFYPYTCGNNNHDSNNIYYGPLEAVFLTESGEQASLLREEISEIVRKWNLTNGRYDLKIGDQPFSHISSVINDLGSKDSWAIDNIDSAPVIRKFLLIFLALLFVPAINLSGMISRRMEGRLAEMGVRKSFGATRSSLLRQVLNENLILTVMGGLLGLAIAWGILISGYRWLFDLFTSGTAYPTSVKSFISMEMIMSPTVFVIAFAVCLTLNIISALIPAWISLRKPIVESMNEKR
ncbi:MAG: ABC transporter permease [Bacteroidaceae bacterium]|nr:ABC transporter permease [Bacteroidaceae bacterium]